MKLWILRHREDLEPDEDPFDPPYDMSMGFVIRASSEKLARNLSAEDAECEFDEEHWSFGNPWLLSKYTTCNELLASGEPEIILTDFCGG